MLTPAYSSSACTWLCGLSLAIPIITFLMVWERGWRCLLLRSHILSSISRSDGMIAIRSSTAAESSCRSAPEAVLRGFTYVRSPLAARLAFIFSKSLVKITASPRTTSREGGCRRGAAAFFFLPSARATGIRSGRAFTVRQLAVNGHDLMETLGLPAGPRI